MKKGYTLLVLFSFLLLAACSKDFLKSYDKRILGNWYIADVNRTGFGGSTATLPFRAGYFAFADNHTLTYTDEAGNMFSGSWKIVKKRGDDETVQTLQVTAVNFTTQQVLTEYYDDMSFVGSDHFKATTISGAHSYVTHFRR